MSGPKSYNEKKQYRLAQQAAMQSPRKKRGEKPKEEGNTFGKELKAARDKGEKTFVVSGKKYEPSRIVEPYRPEFGLDEAKKKPVCSDDT